MKQTARLTSWRIEDICGAYVLVGMVFGHPRLPDGEKIRTSLLKSIDFEKGEAETCNTIYKLEG